MCTCALLLALESAQFQTPLRLLLSASKFSIIIRGHSQSSIHVLQWRTVYDEYNDEEVTLTKEEMQMIQRIRAGRFPHVEV